MTSVQPPVRILSTAAINPNAPAFSTSDWQMFDKPETLEDIRFTFSIWHQPVKTESQAKRTDDGSRARTASHAIRQAVPFAWLPLLPIEAPVEVVDKREGSVVSTGYPLVLPIVDEEAAPPTNLVRRASVAVIDAKEETLKARKKQRLDVDSQDLEAVEATIDHSRNASPGEVKRKEASEFKIQKVRMRDVDTIEDFLDQFLPEFGTGVPLRVLLGTPGVSALAVQATCGDPDTHEASADALDPSVPILALIVYRKTRLDNESVTTHMQAIAVRPSSRRLGLGQQLVREALKDSRRNVGSVVVPRIRLRAEGYDGNGSREFWQRCIAGFQVSSRRIGCRRGWTGEAQL